MILGVFSIDDGIFFATILELNLAVVYSKLMTSLAPGSKCFLGSSFWEKRRGNWARLIRHEEERRREEKKLQRKHLPSSPLPSFNVPMTANTFVCLPPSPAFSSHLLEMCTERGRGREKTREEEAIPNGSHVCLCPTNNSLLNKVSADLRCTNFVNKHRMSVQTGAKRAKTCMQCVHVPTELPLCIPPLVVGLSLDGGFICFISARK